MTQEETFIETYKPVTNHLVEDAPFGGCMFETYDTELTYVFELAKDENKLKYVWTIVEADGKIYYSAGFWRVNRMGYIITEVPWVTGQEEFMVEGCFGENEYWFDKCDFETDEAWYDIIHKQLGLPKFHELFNEGGWYKEEYVHYFGDDFEMDVTHTNISSSNKDNYELLCSVFKLDEKMLAVLQEKLTSSYYKIEGVNYGFKLTNYDSFQDMECGKVRDEFVMDFSEYE
jgi:hypothetical protein